MKALLKRQLKNIPSDQQDKIIAALEKDPHFFQDLAKQIQDKVKEGRDQQAAASEVLLANQHKLSEIFK
ncbi:MAG TPA: hypothetical protein P5328_00760 [Candidatus Paceibacterota bacterium]|nr:hypothetical protein [Candidatus Paceibacterota bacterium]HRZ34520.1 hypothetical protein [Candidatus Paceibacterota bacterium]